jgi:hypothetical protein
MEMRSVKKVLEERDVFVAEVECVCRGIEEDGVEEI